MTQTVQDTRLRAIESRATSLIQRVSLVLLDLERLLSRSVVLHLKNLGLQARPKKVSISSVDSPYSALDHYLVVCDMTGGDITVNLPATPVFPIRIKREGTGNTLTVNPGTGQTINGDTTLTIGGDQTTIDLLYDGVSEFHII